jgi:hypothetical protein
VFTTFAYRTLSLIGCSLALGAAASPVAPGDVRAERDSIPRALAQEKVEAIAMFRASQQPLLWQRAMSGISRIENKLQSAQTNAAVESSALLLTLGDKKLSLHADVLKQSYTAYRPTNGMPLYVDRNRRRAPETYVDPEILKSGVNILTLKGTNQVPACLSGEALENYLHLRCDQKLQTGDYWRELHARKLDDEQLARLRYYDYLDTHVALRSVPAYQCTEIRSRNH